MEENKNTKEVIACIVQFLRDNIGETKGGIKLTMSFSEAGLSSLNVVELILHLEKSFQVQMASNMPGRISTLQDIVDIIQNEIVKKQIREQELQSIENKIFNNGDEEK